MPKTIIVPVKVQILPPKPSNSGLAILVVLVFLCILGVGAIALQNCSGQGSLTPTVMPIIAASTHVPYVVPVVPTATQWNVAPVAPGESQVQQPAPARPLDCSDMKPVLSKGMTARVNVVDPDNLNIHTKPVGGSPVEEVMASNTKVTILDGPYCDNGVYLFWKVRLPPIKGSLIGYAAETDNEGSRYLLP